MNQILGLGLTTASQQIQIAELEPAQIETTPLRKSNLHAGAWTVADDFDAPLPDDFWFGTKEHDSTRIPDIL